MPEQLDVPSLPVELDDVWKWWVQLNATRSKGMDVERITFTEIKNWRDLYNYSISPFELDCLVAIDSEYMRIRAEQITRRQPKTEE